MVGGRADGGKESRGADGAWAGLFRNCEGPALLAAARAHVSVFRLTLCASGAAAWLELMPPLYGSINLTRACLRLRLPIRAVAGGLDSSVLSRACFRPCIAPICFAVLAYMEPH